MDLREVLAFKPATPLTNSGTSSQEFVKRPDKSGIKRKDIPYSNPVHPETEKRRRLDPPETFSKPRANPANQPITTASNGAPATNITNISLPDDDDDDDKERSTNAIMDEGQVKRIVLQLEKKTLRNQEMRIKFPDNPEKFMESEIELHDLLQEMQVIATTPEHYNILVQLRTVDSLLQLISHENVDISLAVIDLIQEMTEADALQESPQACAAFVDALLAGQLVPLLVNNFSRLDESVKEESEGLHTTLGIFENLCEFRPDVCSDLAKQGVLQWLLKRLQKREYDANKLYASEILAILLQTNENNRQMVGEIDGIDMLLQQLATYKRHDPNSIEECELMENLFNALCSALLLKSNREKFLKGEGLQLMNLMLREKKLARNSALKVLDFAMSGEDGADNCTKFVDILGLRTIYPLLMRTPKFQKRAGPSQREMEEHIISVVANLLARCQGQQKQRVLSKFLEKDHEKVDRIIELHFKYFALVKSADARIQRERQDPSLWTSTTAEELEEEIYIRRLEAGLCTLQLIDIIILEICVNGQSSIKERVFQLLRMRTASPKVLLRIVEECADNLGDEREYSSSKRSDNKEKSRLLRLIEDFETKV